MPLPPLVVSQRGPGRLARWFAGVALSISGLGTLIAINAAQTASLVLRPFSRRAFRRFNRWCAATWWGACVVAAERINGTRLILSGDAVPASDNALVVSNHQQMPDITTIMALARSRRRLGDLKFFVKKAIRWVPGIGWGMQFINCPFIARDWSADRSRIERTFRTLVDERIPLWLVSFVEGTRATADKIAASQAFARSRGMEELEHVLLPRTKGFVASVQGLRDHLSAVYDVTIGYVGGVPTLWQYITGAVDRVHVHVRRFPVEDLPRLEEDLSAWLYERFREKDRLLEHFYRHGAFPGANEPVSA